MTHPIKIDIVSDVTCPWCIIGLRGLEEALVRAGDAVDAEIHFHPFELNPAMPPEGQNIAEHFSEKYGSTPEQLAQAQENVRSKAAELDFNMAMNAESRAWNTFDAHRLLHWAGLESLGSESTGRQHALKKALFEAYFTENRAMSDADVLVAAAEKAGLDGAAAREVLSSGRYADYVRRAEQFWQQQGIHAVPAFIFEGKYLVSGAQAPETFEAVMRQVAAKAA
jgi:predicted DsbA family dithiol-disulfide isomerase